jgi:hypothetical protein
VGGEKGAGRTLLKDLANRLRKDPTKNECEVVASLLMRAAEAPTHRVAEALYLSTPHRPRASSIEEHRVALEVMINLLEARKKNKGASSENVYKAVAKDLNLAHHGSRPYGSSSAYGTATSGCSGWSSLRWAACTQSTEKQGLYLIRFDPLRSLRRTKAAQ